MKILRSLRSRRLLVLGLAYAVLLAGLVVHVTSMRAHDLGRARQGVQRTAELIASMQAVALERAHARMHYLLPLREVRNAEVSSAACRRALAGALAQWPEAVNVFAAGPDGGVLCSAAPVAPSVREAELPAIRAALGASHFVLGEPLGEARSGALLIALAEHIAGEAGRPAGVLVALIRFSWSHAERLVDELPAGSRLEVMDGPRVVLRYPEAGAAGKPVARAAQSGLVSSGHEGIAAWRDRDGVRWIYAVVPSLASAAGRMAVLVGEPQEAVTGPIDRAYVFESALAVGLLAATFAIVWFGSEKLLLRRVRILAGAAKQLSEGRLSARSELRASDDELGELTRSFDQMAEQLEARETERESAKQDLERTNRALRVLSGGNRALVRAAGEQALLDEMCRVIVEEGGYRMAWVGFAGNDERKSILPVAHRGAAQRYLEGLGLTWADTERGSGPSGRAIRSAEPVIVRNILAEPGFEPWRAEALELGYASTAALPVKTEGQVLGVLRVYAGEVDAFGTDEVRVLMEAAGDLAFGIRTLRARTEQARLAAALNETEDRLRAALQGSLDGFCMLRAIQDDTGTVADFRFLELNSQAEALLKRPREQLLGRTFRELFPAYPELFQRYASAAAAGKSLEDQFEMRTPAGRSVWVRHQIVPLAGGIAVFWRDITEGMEASQRLKASEKKYRELLEGLQEGIWAMDAEGRTTFVNPRMAEMLGYGVEEMLGKPVFGFVNERGAATLRERMELRRRGLRESYELDWLRKDGTSLYARVEGSPLYDDEGNYAGFLAGIVDLSERRRNELALARSHRALATLSAANAELVRATDEARLLQAVCRVIVEHGGYPLAWVGYAAEDPGKSVAPKAWAGVGADAFLARLKLSWAEGDAGGEGPAGQAIRTAKVQLLRDIATAPGFARSRRLALEKGTRSILALPLLPRSGHAAGFLSIHAAEPDAFDPEEVALLRELAEDLGYGIAALRARAERDRIAYEHLHHEEILRKSLLDSIEAIAATVEIRDPYTAGHQKRVAQLAVALARELGLPEEKIRGLYLAGVVHDLGKIAVPAEILSKPGKLAKVEFELIKQHADSGYEILKGIDFPWPIADIVRQHHERLDGSGYPQGLKDGAILPEARILAVADTVEAMASHRPYRPSLGIERALGTIESERGIAYDAAVVGACVKLFREGRFSFDEERTGRAQEERGPEPRLG